MATPDEVVEQRPAVCAGCQAPLAADAPVVLRERRQVQDLPPLRPVVREHQALHLRCPQCQAVTFAAFPAEAPSRAQYGPQLRALVVCLVQQQLIPYGRVREVLADLFGAQLSLGTLVQWVQQAATVLEPVEAELKAALGQVPVLHVPRDGGAPGGARGLGLCGQQRAAHPLHHPPTTPSTRNAAATRPTPSASCLPTGA